MLSLLYSLGWVLAGGVLLHLLDPAVRSCRQRVQRFQDKQDALPSPVPDVSDDPPEPDPLPEVPEAQTAAFYFRRAFSGWGLVGLCSIPVLLVFLPLNTSILAEAFEILLDRLGTILGEFYLFGLRLIVTDLHLYGLVLALALLLLGAAYAELYENRSPQRWVVLLAGLLGLWALEVGVSAYRGYMLALDDARSPILYAAFNGLQAHICAFVEAFSGGWALHNFLLPLLQAGVWMMVAPFRAVRRWCVSRYRSYAVHRARKQALIPLDTPGAFVRLGAYLDEGLFEPLRSLDGAVRERLRLNRKEVSHA